MMANGLELSRLASPILASEAGKTPGWPGRLQRVVRRKGYREGGLGPPSD